MGILPGLGVPLVQPLLMGQPPLKPFFGVGAPLLETKAARGVLSTDRSPTSDEMHDPVTTHMASEESSYILDAVAGDGNGTAGSLHVPSSARQFMHVSEMSKCEPR